MVQIGFTWGNFWVGVQEPKLNYHNRDTASNMVSVNLNSLAATQIWSTMIWRSWGFCKYCRSTGASVGCTTCTVQSSNRHMYVCIYIYVYMYNICICISHICQYDLYIFIYVFTYSFICTRLCIYLVSLSSPIFWTCLILISRLALGLI